MTDSPSSPAPTAERKKLTPAAERALAEAEARRKAAEASATPHQRSSRARRVRNRPGMAIGNAKASLRTFESKKGLALASRLSP